MANKPLKVLLGTNHVLVSFVFWEFHLITILTIHCVIRFMITKLMLSNPEESQKNILALKSV